MSTHMAGSARPVPTTLAIFIFHSIILVLLRAVPVTPFSETAQGQSLLHLLSLAIHFTARLETSQFQSLDTKYH